MADSRTKQMLIEEIEQLRKEIKEIENREMCKEPTNMLRSVYEEFIAVGFNEKQAFQLTRDTFAYSTKLR